MKLTTFILLISLVQVSAASFAQKVTLKENSISIEKIFREIRKQTGLGVVFDKSEIDKEKKLQVSFNNTPLKEVMEKVLIGTQMTYAIEDNIIVITPKEKSPLDKMAESWASIEVRGRVMDEKGQPMGGATVKIKGTNRTTITNDKGIFSLNNVDEDAVLEISYLGYKMREVKAEANMGELIMELSNSELEEINVSTGYWNTVKRLSVGNIAKVSAKDIENQPVTNPLMALQGRMAGVDIRPISGAPGAAVNIHIRGRNSLRSDGDYPLYVIDGVPINSTPLRTSSTTSFGGGFDPLSTINPSNIESIEVLKDASSTAIYGSRGANGVILITTKKPKPNTASLDINLYSGAGVVPNFLDLLNTEQYLMMRNEALKNDELTPQWYDYDINGTWDKSRNTDWQKKLIGNTAHIYDAQIGLSGGSSNTSYRFSLGYHREGSVLLNKDFGFKSVTGNLGVNHLSDDKKFAVNFALSYGSTLNNLYDSSSSLSSALTLPPNAPELYTTTGKLNWEVVSTPHGMAESWHNPIAILNNKQETETKNFVASSNVSYQITEGLKAIARVGFTTTSSNEVFTLPISALIPSTINSNTTTASTFGNNRRQTWVIEPQLQYIKEVNNHSFEGNFGLTFQGDETLYQSLLADGYKSDAMLKSLTVATSYSYLSDENSQYKYMAGYGRLGYRYKNKFLIDISARRDGSSRFGPEQRFGNFGAVGAGWIFSKETALSSLKFLSFGKIRASYGLTGNDQIGDYSFLDTYSVNGGQYQGAITISPSTLFNSKLIWEKTKKLEIGLELGFLKDRIVLESSVYRNRSTNQIVQRPLPLITGFSSVSDNFDAVIQNLGFEFLLSTKNISTKSFSWLTSFNFSIQRNKLVEFNGLESSETYSYIYKVGQPLSIQNFYTWTGLDPQTGLHTFKDVNNNGYTDFFDAELLKPVQRDYFGGVNNTLNYKNFELSFLLQFAKQTGYKDYLGQSGRMSNRPVSVLNRWTKPGDITDVAKFSSNGSISDNFSDLNNSDFRIENSSFIRLKTFSLAYTLPPKIGGYLGFNSFKAFIQGQNLLTFTKSENLDPETGNSLPPLRMINIGLQVKF